MLKFVKFGAILTTQQPKLIEEVKKILTMSVDEVAQLASVTKEKILADLSNGYLRGLYKNKQLLGILKDPFLQNYVQHNGDITKLKPFGYAPSLGKYQGVYNGFHIYAKIPQKITPQKPIFVYVHSPMGEVETFKGYDYEKVYAQALSYISQNSQFGWGGQHAVLFPLTKMEVELISSYLPLEKYPALDLKFKIYQIIFNVSKRRRQNEREPINNQTQ